MGLTILLRHIRARFGKPTKAVVTAIEACQDLDQLNAWLDRVLTANNLGEVGITGPKEASGQHARP
jgi:hypothetical protein